MIQLAITFIINLIVLMLPVFVYARFKKVEFRKASAYFGTFYILLYLLAITIPFHFQGYSTLIDAEPSEPLGWTSTWLIGLFAYLYTFKANAFAWLAISTVLIAQGEFIKHSQLNFILKSLVILIASWILMEVYKYTETINMVLE